MLPSDETNAKAALALEILPMPATKRRASYDAWSEDRLGGAMARIEELKATMNAHIHNTSTIVVEAEVAALHSAAEAMQHDAAKHREFDARARKAPVPNRPSAPPPPPGSDTDDAMMTQGPADAVATQHKNPSSLAEVAGAAGMTAPSGFGSHDVDPPPERSL